jgi:hypothetical protein
LIYVKRATVGFRRAVQKEAPAATGAKSNKDLGEAPKLPDSRAAGRKVSRGMPNAALAEPWPSPHWTAISFDVVVAAPGAISRLERFSTISFETVDRDALGCRSAGGAGAEGPRLEDGGPGVRLDRRYPLYFLIPMPKIYLS